MILSYTWPLLIAYCIKNGKPLIAELYFLSEHALFCENWIFDDGRHRAFDDKRVNPTTKRLVK